MPLQVILSRRSAHPGESVAVGHRPLDCTGERGRIGGGVKQAGPFVFDLFAEICRLGVASGEA